MTEIISKCYMEQTDASRVLCFFKFIDTYLNFVSVGEHQGCHGNKLKQQSACDVLGCLVLAMPVKTQNDSIIQRKVYSEWCCDSQLFVFHLLGTIM